MKKSWKLNNMHYLVLGVLGVLMILFKEPFKDIMYILLGVGLLITAVLGVLEWWKAKSKAPEALTMLLGYILLGLAGIWIFSHPATFDTIINVIIGLILILYGAMGLYRAWQGDKDTLTMVIGAIAVIMGLVIAFNNAATSWVVIAEGIGLIYTAVTGLFLGSRLG